MKQVIGAKEQMLRDIRESKANRPKVSAPAIRDIENKAKTAGIKKPKKGKR